ncbi:MAG TPA: beta-ketoacyl synthase N-terminal-like domain-containing protein, partial [Anaerolineales bacterium]|nr:beta-ketoacyl synthase N-terminal-like domain-containing protein [Anaerolineales bacterium]
MRKRVVVTGLGCVSPVGNNVKDTWEALLAGKSGAAPITAFDASAHKTKFASEVKGFDGAALFGTRESRKMDRFTQFATAATLEALEHSGLKIDESNRDRVGILIGTGIGGIITTIEQYENLKERGPERVSPFLIPMMIADSA